MIPEYPKANTIAGHMEHYPMQQQHYVDDNACVLSPVLSSSEGSCSSSCYGKFVVQGDAKRTWLIRVTSLP